MSHVLPAALGAAVSAVIAVFAGAGCRREPSASGPAAPAPMALVTPRRLVHERGALLIADPDAQRVFRLNAGALEVIAGTGEACGAGCCEGAPDARQAPLASPADVALLGSDLLIANSRAGCVLRVTGGRLVPWLGRRPATQPIVRPTPLASAQLAEPEALLARPDGAVWIADARLCQVLRVDPQGATVTPFAGTGVCGFAGDGGLALEAQLRGPGGLAEGPDGSLYIADTDNGRVRVVGPDGRIETVAGTGERGTSGLGGPANRASLNEPEGLLALPGNQLLILDTDNNRVLLLRGPGRGEAPGGSRTGSPNAGVPELSLVLPTGGFGLRYPKGAARTPTGELWIADTDNARLLRLPAASPSAQASPEIWPPGAPERFQEVPDGLSTAEREERYERLKGASPAERPDRFRELTDDLELEPADRDVRWETLGPDPLDAFEALLKRTRKRG